MPDINLRFHKDMLVCTNSVIPILKAQGLIIDKCFPLLFLLEKESLEQAYNLQKATMAQCLTTESFGFTPARLMHCNMTEELFRLATLSLEIVNNCKPQHVLVEIGPCGLPLDGASRQSLRENCEQYERVGRAFLQAKNNFDAFLLSGFNSLVDLKCALMGLAKLTSKPLIASVNITGNGLLCKSGHTVTEAADMMQDYGASVVGFQSAADLSEVLSLVDQMRSVCTLPLIVSLEVGSSTEALSAGNDYGAFGSKASDNANPHFNSESMIDAGLALHQAGVQFLRATGMATPAYTAALSACLANKEVHNC